MSAFPVGKSGQINLNDVKGKVAYNPSNATEPAHLRIFNDSGSALSIASDDGSIQDYIPAGAWPVYELGQTTKYIDFTVLAMLPNPPIQLLMPTYYIPGEVVPDSPTLGNSPIGIGGTIQTSSVQTLSNEGGTNALVIDIGDATNSNLITIYQDGHALYFVDQGGTKHQVLKMNASGIPLEIGQANDTAQVNSMLNIVQATGLSLQTTNNAKIGGTLESVGAATMDGTLTVTGDATLNGAGTGLAVTNNETVGGTLVVTGDTTLNGAGTGLAVANNETVGGTLGVTGATTLSALLTAAAANFSGLIQPNQIGTSVNGSIAGFVAFDAHIWGSGLKILIITIAGFNSATIAQFNFPSTLSHGVAFMGNLGSTTWGIFSGVGAQTLAQVTSLGVAGAAGASTGETTLHGNNLVWFEGITGTNIQIGTTSGAITASGIVIGI